MTVADASSKRWSLFPRRCFGKWSRSASNPRRVTFYRVTKCPRGLATGICAAALRGAGMPRTTYGALNPHPAMRVGSGDCSQSPHRSKSSASACKVARPVGGKRFAAPADPSTAKGRACEPARRPRLAPLTRPAGLLATPRLRAPLRALLSPSHHRHAVATRSTTWKRNQALSDFPSFHLWNPSLIRSWHITPRSSSLYATG